MNRRDPDFAARPPARPIKRRKLTKPSLSRWPGRRNFSLDLVPPDSLITKDGRAWIIRRIDPADRAAFWAEAEA
jgi:hypothetical protein